MRLGGGRAKGNAFERKIAKQIVAAFAHKGIVNEDCYRTPGSGGHRYASKKDPGDLQFSERMAALMPFTVECKKYAFVDWKQLFTGMRRESLLSKWWAQAVRAAKLRDPLLVFAANGTEPFVMLRRGSLHGVMDKRGGRGWPIPRLYLVDWEDQALVVMPFEGLLYLFGGRV